MSDIINKLIGYNFAYKKITLGDIGKVCMCKRIMKNQTSSSGDIPFYKIGTFGKKADAFISRELFEEYKNKYSYPKKGEVLISCSGTIGRTVVFDGEDAYFQDSNIVWISNDETLVLNEYLKYLYELNPFVISSGGTITRLYNDGIERAVVCVPPIDIQREIVHILDNFAELTAELTAKLAAEITAREQLYNFYKDKIIGSTECTEVKLNEIATIYDGTHQTPEYKTDGIPFISVENIKNIYSSKKYVSAEAFEKYKIKPQINDVFMTRIGSIGKCAVMTESCDLAYYVSLALIRPNTNRILPEYLKYYIESMYGKIELAKRTLTHAVPIKINKDEIGKITIKLPTIEKQKEVISFLSRFDDVTNSIVMWLPAEIEARQKQYEYYRDKLLTFKEAE